MLEHITFIFRIRTLDFDCCPCRIFLNWYILFLEAFLIVLHCTHSSSPRCTNLYLNSLLQRSDRQTSQNEFASIRGLYGFLLVLPIPFTQQLESVNKNIFAELNILIFRRFRKHFSFIMHICILHTNN